MKAITGVAPVPASIARAADKASGSLWVEVHWLILNHYIYQMGFISLVKLENSTCEFTLKTLNSVLLPPIFSVELETGSL